MCRVLVVESNNWLHIVCYISNYAASCMLRAVYFELYVVGCMLCASLCIILRAVFSPHGLTNTCARQASGSVSRCVSLQDTSVSGFSTVAHYSQCSEDAHSAMPPVAQHTSEPKSSALIVHSASITVRQQRSNSCGIEYYRPLPLCT